MIQRLSTLQKIVCVLALLLVVGTYANSFENTFHFDDFHTVVDNPSIRSLRNVPKFFTDATTFSVLPANRTYRPFVSATLALDYAMGHGYAPFWFHLSTFVFFIGLLVLLFLLYEAMLERVQPAPRNVWIALLTAAWFGVHPAIAETVNYVIQRGDVFCTLGCVAALVVWARKPALRRYGIYLLPLAFALLSKPPAAVFPVLLFFYAFFFEETGRGRAKRAAVAMLPSLAVTIALMVMQSAMTPKTFAPSMFSASSYRLAQPYVWLRYVGALVLPVHLSVDTDLAPFANFDLRALVGLVFVAALGAAIWLASKRKIFYPIAYGLIWFVVTEIPTSIYTLAEVENDHRMFFAFVGLMIAAVWTVYLLCSKLFSAEMRVKLRPVAAVCAVLMLSAYAWGAHLRNATWKTEETLWLDNTIKSPHNGRGLMIYGLTQMNKGAYPQALDYFERALKYTPNYATLEVNLGVVHGAMEGVAHTAAAEQHFQRAIALAPNDDTTYAFYGRFLRDRGRLPEAMAQLQQAITLNPARMMQRELLMDVYARMGRVQDAKDAAVAVLRIAPDDVAAQQFLQAPTQESAAGWINQSLALYQQGRYTDAIDAAKHALKLDAKSAVAYNNIGASYAGMQQWDEAIKAEQEAVRLQPELQIAQNNLRAYQASRANPTAPVKMDFVAWIDRSLALNKAGKFNESIAAAHEALKLNPKSAEAWNNIAANEEAQAHWDAAIAAAQKAIALKPDFQLAKNNLAWSISQKAKGAK